MTICYSFASRSRPERFYQALDNIIQMSASKDFFIVAKLDEDDTTMNNAEMWATLAMYPQVIVKWGTSKSKIHAINRDLEDIPHWDILICMSDDMRFLVQGFDNIIRQHCGPDQFVHFPDGHVGRRLCTMAIMGVSYYRRFGYIAHPSYFSLWCDNEWQDVAKRLHKYKYVRQQIFEHQHHANGFGPKDALLEHTESFHDVDKQNYINRKRRGFPVNY